MFVKECLSTKKFVRIVSCLLISAVFFYSTAYAASVTPQLYPGNDSAPTDYTLPAGYVHYEIPSSNSEGTHTVTFDSAGSPAVGGSYSFTFLVGNKAEEDYAKVLSWSSNFPVYAVVVGGDDRFYLYLYDRSVRDDSDLISPPDSTGIPMNINHISIILNPNDLPAVPPTPTVTPTPVITSAVYASDSSAALPESYLAEPTSLYILYIAMIVAFFLIGLILGLFLGYARKTNKKEPYAEIKDNEKDKAKVLEKPTPEHPENTFITTNNPNQRNPGNRANRKYW